MTQEAQLVVDCVIHACGFDSSPVKQAPKCSPVKGQTDIKITNRTINKDRVIVPAGREVNNYKRKQQRE